YGQVIDAQELFLVEHHLLTRQADHVVLRGQFDGIDRAGLLAHAAEDAPQLIDLELLGVLLAVVPGALRRFDVDAPGRADRRAHHARDALDPSLLIPVQPVNAPEV